MYWQMKESKNQTEWLCNKLHILSTVQLGSYTCTYIQTVKWWMIILSYMLCYQSMSGMVGRGSLMPLLSSGSQLSRIPASVAMFGETELLLVYTIKYNFICVHLIVSLNLYSWSGWSIQCGHQTPPLISIIKQCNCVEGQPFKLSQYSQSTSFG